MAEKVAPEKLLVSAGEEQPSREKNDSLEKKKVKIKKLLKA